MFSIVPLIIIIVCLLAIIVVVLRRYSDILVIDPDTIPEERDRMKKNEILSGRLERRSKAAARLAGKALRPLGNKAKKGFLSSYKKLLEYERTSKKATGEPTFAKPSPVLPAQAPPEPSEEDYIAMLEEDSKDTGAYFGLAEIYRKKGDLAAARETLEHTLRLEPTNPRFLDALVDLGIMEGEAGRAKDALLRLKEANPENGKIPELEKRIAEL